MELRVLGPVEVRRDDRVVAVGRPQQRLLMAALAVDAGRPVPVETLVDRVWDEAPAGARRTLHVLVTRLRRVLEQASGSGQTARVLRHAGGYVLDVEPERVDLLRFNRLVARARDPGRTETDRVVLFREALALWRGEPLSGIAGQWAARTRLALRQQHLEAVVAWARAELRGGDPAAVVGPLTDLAGEHPLTESVTEVLMRALSVTGRPADAVALYATTRERLATELGTDPAAELQAVHQQILRGELAPAVTAGIDTSGVPRQLPAAVRYFAGRSAELAALTALLDDHADNGGGMIIATISGMAGVGKSALAVHWAHQVRNQFPAGQLYVNLRGLNPAGTALEPTAVIRGFLDALVVAPQRIPVDLDGMAALYRSELAERPMLIVLDNARDCAQVRPLLPGAGCLVLVTSRNQLSGLVATDNAHPVNLNLLTPPEARHLLAHRLGHGRVRTEPDAVDQVINRCAGLPLALSIVAARAATHPHLPLHTLATELRDAGSRLNALSIDDPHADLRAVFSWSYQTLAPPAASLFRLLGLHPGPDLSTAAAASLAGLPPPPIRPLLNTLVRVNLVLEHTPGRYTMHDLLRSYAADLAHRLDTEEQRRAATRRMLDHYLHTAYTADRTLYPAREPIVLPSPQPGVTPEQPADHHTAMDWFTTEHRALLAALDHAAATGYDAHTWQLAWTLTTFLRRRGHWHDWITAGHAAEAAADRQGDRTAQARANRQLAAAHTRLRLFDEAHTDLRRALELTTATDDLAGQAHTHWGLSMLCEQQHHYTDALHHAEQAHDLYRAAGHQSGQADALNAIGWEHAQLGNYTHALAACQQALTLLQELNDPYGQANTWDSLGYAHHHLGHHTQAITCYHHARQLFRDLGDRYWEATTLTRLGTTHHTTGNHQAAHDAWHQALTILNQLHHPDAQQVRANLANLD
jgi:DNA-binding SARP family transcriptional activator/tetratricopeptide (TPR) repeat protein